MKIASRIVIAAAALAICAWVTAQMVVLNGPMP